ncbi:MAG: CPBP family intramembrane metalloprotease, partial [Candidatus Omnitrophica bacterium]|nr:CPBP family intramembrane metalloprotease [Candidatus Omnitrophota bacterium]
GIKITERSFMKGFLKFVVIFAAILLLSAFLAPLFYDFFKAFHPYKFERIFQRIVMILSLIAVACFVRVKKETLVSYGLAWKSQSPGLFGRGFMFGVLTLGLVGLVRVLSGQAVFAPDSFSPWGWILKFVLALGTALLIGTMEEFFFRGFVFRSLMHLSKSRVFLSVLVTTSFYALIHFIGMKKIFVDSDPNFLDGLRLIGAPFLSLAQWPQFWPEAAGLFLFGLALNGAACRSGSLYPAIGLHAGCVFYVKLDDSFLQFHADRTFFWGSKVLYDGLVGWLFLGAIALVMWTMLKPSNSGDPGVRA